MLFFDEFDVQYIFFFTIPPWSFLYIIYGGTVGCDFSTIPTSFFNNVCMKSVSPQTVLGSIKQQMSSMLSINPKRNEM